MESLNLPLTEWIVLALIAERPCHGFAIASLTAQDAEIGRLWYVSQPMVYRSITRLAERGLISPTGTEDSQRGPQRIVYSATRPAKLAATRWLSEPVLHIREVRADLIIKFVLLRRRDISPSRLIERQRIVINELEAALRANTQVGDDFSRAIYAWRLEHAQATRRLLDAMDTGTPARSASRSDARTR